MFGIKNPIGALPSRLGKRSFRLLIPAAGMLSIFSLGSFGYGHDGDPKGRPEPSVHGEIVRGGDSGFDSRWESSGDGIVFCSQIPVNMLGGTGNGADLWHHVSPAGSEYAIVTTKESVAFVDVTDPFQPAVVHTHDRDSSSSLWGDVKVIGEYAYVDGEGGGGIRVFDMREIDSGVVTFEGATAQGKAHNIVSCPEAGLLIRVGQSVRFYDVSQDPVDLEFLGSRSDRFVHDARFMVYPEDGPDEDHRGEIIGFLNDGFNSGWVDPGLSIVSFGTRDDFDPQGETLGRVTWEDGGYSHQCWESEDLRWLYSNDETSSVLNSTWQCIDISDLDNPILGVQQTNGRDATNHNLFVKDGILFAANYKDGIRLLAATGNDLEEIASFDTYPSSDSAGYQGCWGVDPFLPSGTILASDMQSGLFVLRLDEPVKNEPAFEFPEGLPDRIDAEGFELVVEIDAFPAEKVLMDYESLFGGFGVVEAVPAGTPDRFIVAFPESVACPDEILYSFRAESSAGEVIFDPSGPYTANYADSEVLILGFDGTDATGWTLGTPGDTASDGVWNARALDPNDLFGPPADSGGDANCFMTGDGLGDVDGGFTTLVTPGLDPFGLVMPVVRFNLWLQFDDTIPANDRFEIAASNDGGESWALLELVTTDTDGWDARSIELDPAASPTDIRIRFRAYGESEIATVVAAVDQFQLLEWVCDDVVPGDMNGDGFVDGKDFGQFLIEWGSLDSPADFNFDGNVDGIDLGILLGHWTG
jgi:choice-of-anchor B domain-containing protein